jgi:iron complex outermembrane receptor protein
LHAALASAQSPDELKRMTLNELLNVEVSTVSRVPEATALVPAAVHVITQDDIRRSGATSIPEALRLAPGIHVARIDAARWAIGVRGFADRLARSMLVLIDGRAVYSPLFAGTYWEVQDTPLVDIERIEVIRGPGGTLWGANAVNGIINIVTRRAQDTHGLVVRTGAGAGGFAQATVRHGGALGQSGDFRTYVKGFTRGPAFHRDGQDYDDWRMAQAGFRADWSRGAARGLTVQGDVYRGELGQRAPLASFSPPFLSVSNRDAPLSGGNLLARWRSGSSGRGDVQVQAYYDRTRRDEVPVRETRDTFDADFQQTLRRWSPHAVSWGLGYRVSAGRIGTAGPTAFTPGDRTDHLVSGFVQDEISLVPDRFRVALGGKVEHNSYSGIEFQPSGRFTWTPDPQNTVVGSVTRAVRTPSRVETDYSTNSLVNPSGPIFVRLLPNPDFVSEKLTAYELGYRVRPGGSLYLTVSAFFNHLNDTLSTELLPTFVEASPAPARLILPVTFANGLHGSSYGTELTADVRPAAWWRVTASYSHLQIEMTRDPGSRDVSQERRYEGLSPAHMGHVQVSVDLPEGWSVDWLLRGASRLRAGQVPGYATSDVRVGWRVSRHLELGVVGQNLHEARHREWASDGPGIEIERNVHVLLTWRP